MINAMRIGKVVALVGISMFIGDIMLVVSTGASAAEQTMYLVIFFEALGLMMLGLSIALVAEGKRIGWNFEGVVVTVFFVVFSAALFYWAIYPEVAIQLLVAGRL